MKIEVTFDSWEEMEAFRTSGKKTRGKGQKDDADVTVEEVTEKVAAMNAQMATQPPVSAAVHTLEPQTFTPPATAVQPPAGFPGTNGATPPPSTQHPLVSAIQSRIDGAIASGQPADAIVTWFRQQIGPEAANATLDQIKQVFIPRMSEAVLKQIAPQLGIQA
jgi:hypothetical protein